MKKAFKILSLALVLSVLVTAISPAASAQAADRYVVGCNWTRDTTTLEWNELDFYKAEIDYIPYDMCVAIRGLADNYNLWQDFYDLAKGAGYTAAGTFVAQALGLTAALPSAIVGILVGWGYDILFSSNSRAFESALETMTSNRYPFMRVTYLVSGGNIYRSYEAWPNRYFVGDGAKQGTFRDGVCYLFNLGI